MQILGRVWGGVRFYDIEFHSWFVCLLTLKTLNEFRFNTRGEKSSLGNHWSGLTFVDDPRVYVVKLDQELIVK